MNIKNISPIRVGGLITFVENEYSGDKGELVHHINGVEVARIPPEGFEGYVKDYPACEPVVLSLLGRTVADPQANIPTESAPKSPVDSSLSGEPEGTAPVENDSQGQEFN